MSPNQTGTFISLCAEFRLIVFGESVKSHVHYCTSSCKKKPSDVRTLPLKDTAPKIDALVNAHDVKGVMH